MLPAHLVFNAPLTKFTCGSSLLLEKSFARGQIKSRRKSLVKKTKQNRPNEERVTSVYERKTSLGISIK